MCEGWGSQSHGKPAGSMFIHRQGFAFLKLLPSLSCGVQQLRT